jgi:hypothetical protein
MDIPVYEKSCAVRSPSKNPSYRIYCVLMTQFLEKLFYINYTITMNMLSFESTGVFQDKYNNLESSESHKSQATTRV